MIYRWAPRWQFLDRDDLLHLFCLLNIRISGAQMEDREFPPRLKRQFTNQRNGWRFDGLLTQLEYDDIAYLSSFLKIMVPRDVVEASSFSSRLRVHLTRDEETGDYKRAPDTRFLDCGEVPHVLPWLQFHVSKPRYAAGDFPNRRRCHFKADQLEVASSMAGLGTNFRTLPA